MSNKIILGKGAYGIVYTFFNSSKAYKELNIQDLSWIREISYVKYLNHPNIIKFHDIQHIINDYNEKCVVIEMDRYDTTLSNLNMRNDIDILKIIDNLLSASMYCQNHLIFHRDIKDANILLNNGKDHIKEVIIMDFGLSMYNYPNVISTSNVLTVTHSPPEVEISKQKNGYIQYDSRIDTWSIGIIILNIICRSNFSEFLTSGSFSNKLYFDYGDDINNMLQYCNGNEVCAMYQFILTNPDVFLNCVKKYFIKNHSPLKYQDFYIRILEKCFTSYNTRPTPKQLYQFFENEKKTIKPYIKVDLSFFDKTFGTSLSFSDKTFGTSLTFSDKTFGAGMKDLPYLTWSVDDVIYPTKKMIELQSHLDDPAEIIKKYNINLNNKLENKSVQNKIHYNIYHNIHKKSYNNIYIYDSYINLYNYVEQCINFTNINEKFIVSIYCYMIVESILTDFQVNVSYYQQTILLIDKIYDINTIYDNLFNIMELVNFNPILYFSK